MRSKMAGLMLLLPILMLSVWQVGRLKRGQDEPEVLAARSTKTIEERLSDLENRMYVLEKNAGLIKTKGVDGQKVSFIQLTGGQTAGAEWNKITGTEFSLDTALYGRVTEVTWEGWIDNGQGAVRIYDTTNHRVVDNSEVSVASGSKASFYSKPLSIWRGQNQYYIEGKNVGGEMTLSQPRLKMVTK